MKFPIQLHGFKWKATVLRIITVRKRSLGQGNIFTPVCHSVHKRGGEGST